MCKKKRNTTQTTTPLTAGLVQWATNSGYKKPLVYELNKFRLMIDLATGRLGVIAIDETIKEKITVTLNLANQIADLPSETLEALAYTDDLKEEFNLQRNDNIMIGRCFVFAILKVDGDPLEPEKTSGDVNQWTEEILVQNAYRYRALLELLNEGFEDIKKAFPDMSFNTTEQLFFEIIRDERDSYFERIATSDFMQILTDVLADFYKGVVKKANRTELEKKCIAQGTLSIHKGVWLHKCLNFLEEKGKRNSKIRARLKAYCLESDSLAEAIATACVARSSDGKIKKSIQWRLGQALIFGQRNRPTIPRFT